MCQKILPKALHHNPTKGGQDEDDKFDDWYSRTPESYERLFGEPPPKDIWPPAELRFGVDPFAQRVNLKRYWVVPKRPAKRMAFATAMIAMAAIVVGCSEDQAAVSALVVGGLLAFGLVIYLAAHTARNGSAGGSGCSGAGCGDGGSGFFDFGGGHDSGHGGHSGCGGDSGGGSSGCGSSGCGSGCGGGCGGGD